MSRALEEGRTYVVCKHKRKVKCYVCTLGSLSFNRISLYTIHTHYCRIRTAHAFIYVYLHFPSHCLCYCSFTPRADDARRRYFAYSDSVQYKKNNNRRLLCIYNSLSRSRPALINLPLKYISYIGCFFSN